MMLLIRLLSQEAANHCILITNLSWQLSLFIVLNERRTRVVGQSDRGVDGVSVTIKYSDGGRVLVASCHRALDKRIRSAAQL